MSSALLYTVSPRKWLSFGFVLVLTTTFLNPFCLDQLCFNCVLFYTWGGKKPFQIILCMDQTSKTCIFHFKHGISKNSCSVHDMICTFMDKSFIQISKSQKHVIWRLIKHRHRVHTNKIPNRYKGKKQGQNFV